MRFDEQTLLDSNVFTSVVKCGNYASAARQLNLSPSACSRAVARLEKRLGARVLDRTTRSVSLTEEGRQLFERIDPLLQGFEDAFASVMETRARPRGKLRLKMHPTIAHLITGKQLRSYLEKADELSVEIVNSDKLGDLVAEAVDVALHIGELPSSGMIARRLLDTRVITVAAPSYLRERQTPRHPEDLLKHGHRLIDYRNPETGRPFQWEFHKGPKIVSVRTPHKLVVSDIVTLHRVCGAGWGIAQVLDVAVGELLESGALVQILGSWSDETFPVNLVYPTRNYMSPKVRSFLDFITAMFERNRSHDT